MRFFIFPIFVLLFSLSSYASHHSLTYDSDSEDFSEIETEISLENISDVEGFLTRKTEDFESVVAVYLGSDELSLDSQHLPRFILPDPMFQAIALACPNLRSLNLSLYTQQGMDTITFLQYFPKLEELILSHASIKDFTPLAFLTALKRLTLFNCTHFCDTDVQHLTHLKGTLEQLMIGFNSELSKSGVIKLQTFFGIKAVIQYGL